MRRTSQLEVLCGRLTSIQASMRTQPGAHNWSALVKPADPVETAATRTQTDQARALVLSCALQQPAGHCVPPRGLPRSAVLTSRAFQELMQQHRQVMAQQDETLDVIGRGAQNLHSVAVAINSEVGVHTALLDDLDEGMDRVDTRLAAVHGKLLHTMRKLDSKCLTLLLFLTSLAGAMFLVWCLEHLL